MWKKPDDPHVQDLYLVLGECSATRSAIDGSPLTAILPLATEPETKVTVAQSEDVVNRSNGDLTGNRTETVGNNSGSACIVFVDERTNPGVYIGGTK